MKKLIFSAAVLASAFFAASCQQEMLDPQAEGTTVTYTVDVPNAIATKAIGDEITAVDKVYFEVYRAAEVDDPAKTPVYEGNKPVSNNVATFDLEFVKNQEFVVLFWAQNSALVKTDQNTDGMYDINDLRAIKLVNPGAANNNAAQVFAGKDTVSDCVSAVNGNVTLIRPVSQINVYTTTESLSFGDVTIGLDGSTMTVAGLYHTFNVADGDAVVSNENKATFVYTEAAVPNVAADNADLTYVAMNYVGFAPQAGATVTVDFTINTSEAVDIVHKVSNVPVKPNYRTNITGNLISATADYNVSLNDNWADAGKDMEVLADGIVENINGDYEISTAVGFAYAINKLFADGGTFYIHPGTYDFTGLVVVPQPTKPGALLNVKANEKPVVTRSTPGFEIIGLDVAYLVSEVTNGSQAIFSGLVLPEDTKLVGTNNGVVGVSGCNNEETDEPAELVGNGNGTVVNTVSMASVKDINDAIAQGLKHIELTGDITGLTEIFTISSSVTIDGCGHKLTSRADRAINVSGAEANGVTVTIKNLVIECTGERAINIIQNAKNVTIDNVTATAANYTVNVAKSAPGAEVNIENSTLNGLNTVNVGAPDVKVTINNSTINCNDNNTTAGEAYSALCLNKAAVGAEIIATNTVVNVTDGSDSSKGRNGAEDGTVTINGSTEDVTVTIAVITYPESDYYYGFETVASAIEFAKETDVISLIRNISVEETIVVEEGKTVVLDLNGKTLTASEKCPNGYAITNKGELTIKNNGVINGVVYAEGPAAKTIIDGGTYNALENAKYVLLNSQGASLTINAATINGGSSYPIYSYDANSELVINNATVNATFGCVNAYGLGCTVEINGGTFKMTGVQGKTSHIAYFSKNCTANINGGTFEKIGNISMSGTGGGGICVNGGAGLTINGGSFAGDYDDVYNYGGSIFVKGGTYKFKPDFLADGYKAVQNAESKWEVVAKTYVAQVGDKKYESLQEAFNAGGDITLLSNVTLAEMAVLESGKTATLDLNGYNITVPEAAKHIYAINNKGNLTLKDSKGTGSVKARGIYNDKDATSSAIMTVESGKYYGIDTDGGAAILNRAELVINDGEFFGGYAAVCTDNAKGNTTINSGKFGGAYTDSNLSTNYVIKHDKGVLVVNNAEVVSGFGAIGAYGGTTTIKDGFFLPIGWAGYTCHVVYVAAAADVTINGGTFKMNYPETSVPDSGEAVASYYNGTMTINGGTFYAHFDNVSPVQLSKGSTIKGGTFYNHSGEPSQHIWIKNFVDKEGYELNANGEVVKK